jgi:hypothetical protein
MHSRRRELFQYSAMLTQMAVLEDRILSHQIGP